MRNSDGNAFAAGAAREDDPAIDLGTVVLVAFVVGPARSSETTFGCNAVTFLEILDSVLRVLTPAYLGDDGIQWQRELGCDRWNVYKGSIAMLRSTHSYTQSSGSGGLAIKVCGTTDTLYNESFLQPASTAAFYLVSGVSGGIELGLGTDSAGNPRLNTNPCP